MNRGPLAALAIIALSSCGPNANPFDLSEAGGGDIYSADTVFLYVLNAYAGAEGITVRGPGGRIARNLGYDERAAEDGPCAQDELCVPSAIHRAKGTTFNVKAGGKTVTLDLSEELNAFYPHETGTVIIRGGGAEGIDATVVRHTQTISSECELGVVNALSGGAVDADASFDFAMEWKMAPETAGYRDESVEPLLTGCGPLPTNVAGQESVARDELYAGTGDAPWFVGIECESGWCPRWSPAGTDGRARVGVDGNVEVHPTTDEYFTCLQDAVAMKGSGACPAELSWSDVELDQQKVLECAQPRPATARLTAPGEAKTWAQASDCDTEFRLRTPGQDRLFGPQSDEPAGRHQDGDLVVSRVRIKQGDRHYWVVMGRPVNADVWEWASSETFVDLGAFPME